MRLLPEQIQYYARVFGLQLDEYYRKNSNSEKPITAGTIKPTITTSRFSQLVYDNGERNRPTRAHSTKTTAASMLLPLPQKLSTPKKLNLDDAQITQLAELIVYYLMPSHSRSNYLPRRRL
jgi:hypothetical protein